MATYRQDVTKPLTPSSPDPTSAINAAKASRSIFGTAIEGAANVWEMEKHITMKDAEFQTGEARNEFLRRNQAAETAEVFQGAADRVAGNIAARGTMFGPPTEEDVAVDEKSRAVLEDLSAEAQRLRDAADGGMSNDQYVQRLQVITKKAITKYPGLAQQIRQRLGVVSGLEYNDEWASRQFVADRFAKREGGKADDTEQKLLLKDIDDMAGAGVGSREELLKLRGEDPVGFATKRQMWQESNRAKDFAQKTRDVLAAETALNNEQARTRIPRFIGILEGKALGQFTAAQVTSKQTTLASIVQALAKNGNQWDATDVATMTKALGAEVNGYIESSVAEAKADARDFFNKNPKVDQATRAEIIGAIDARATEMKTLYGDKNNIILMASIFEQHKDKTVEQRLKLLQGAAAAQQAFSNSDALRMYHQGGASREKLKREHPGLHDLFQKLDQDILNGIGVFGSMTAGRDLSRIQTAMDDAAANSNPTPKVGEPKVDKLRLEAIDSAGNTTLKQFVKDGTIDETSANLLTTMFNNGVKDGSNARNYKQQFTFYKGAVEKLPEPVLEELRGKVGREATSAAMGAKTALEAINSARGTKLAFVYQDGSVVVDYEKPTANINTLSGAEDQKLQVEADKNEKAKQEFMKTYGPQLSNIVVLKALLTKESVGAVAQSLANEFDVGEFTTWNATTGKSGASLVSPNKAQPTSAAEKKMAEDVAATDTSAGLTREALDGVMRDWDKLTPEQRATVTEALKKIGVN